MSIKSVLATMTKGIRVDTERCEALLPLLERQQRLLAATDTSGLGEVGEQINRLLQALGESARERVRCLAVLGLPGNAEGMALLLKKLPPPVSEPLHQSWHNLELALAKCKALNERNGELLASQRAILSEIMGQAETGYTGYGEPRD